MTIKCPKCARYARTLKKAKNRLGMEMEYAHCNHCDIDFEGSVSAGFDEFEALHVHMFSRTADGAISKSWNWIDGSV
jgi:transcription elongation factor Elf1